MSKWGAGYFDIGDNGNVGVTPDVEKPHMQIDFASVFSEIQQANIHFPVVVRFHDVLRAQVVHLNKAFKDCINEANYQGQYRGVYPVKVNQMREVVEEIVDAGKEYHYGLEAGSKAELITILAYNTTPEALTVLNGYIDEELVTLDFLAQKLGRKVIIVV